MSAFLLPIPNSTRIENQTLDDAELNTWLAMRLQDHRTVAYAHAHHRCLVFEVGTTDASVHPANPGKSSVVQLKRIARAGRLKRIERSIESLESNESPDATWPLLNATVEDVAAWYRQRETLFGQGRGQAISVPTANQVWHAAGGRCMYRGCGKDVGRTSLTTQSARAAYLAHIVASDPDGPRGNGDSHALSNDPENIMLMCDEHHRLIDRIAESEHPTHVLLEMRTEHEQRVNQLLAGLSYPRTQLITLLANLANLPTNIATSELQGSVLSRRLGPLPNVLHAIRRLQRDDRARPNFWYHLLHEHETDILDLMLKTGNRPSTIPQGEPEVLAIFPLHLVPVLVLAGRILGEARPIEVFQYDRDLKCWRWNPTARPSPVGTIRLENNSSGPADTVLLSLELTAQIDPRTLPSALAAEVAESRIPWIRITHASPGPQCIRHPDDLAQFTECARQAVRLIHDTIRPQRVHLIGVSPASSLFRFGQLLQPGHHPVYQLYDRPDGASTFLPAFKIEGQQVSTTGEDPAKTIPLR